MGSLSMKKEKNIILCDCDASEVESLCEGLNFSDKKFEICSHIANWKRTGKISEMHRYGKYFAIAFKYFIKRKKYGTIIGWQQFYVLIFCFFCSILHVKKSNTLIALNFTYKEKKGKIGSIYRWFMKRCLDTGYIDYIHVPSQKYAKIINEKFQFPIDRIIVLPFGINDPYEKFVTLPYPLEAPTNGYVLSIGRSNRDYDFLISAWENINYPLVIISDTYKGSNKGNANISIIRNVAGKESYPWIAHCAAMVIPIDDGNICSGDTVLLNSMAMKKRVVITVPSTLAEMYIVNKINGISVEKDREVFKMIMLDLLFSEHYDYLQENARESFLSNYSRANMGTRLINIIDTKNNDLQN